MLIHRVATRDDLGALDTLVTTAGRDDALLDPAVDAARVRAMYTHPGFARRGIGRRVLELCERAAAAEGFRRLELVATMSGRPLYEAFGFEPIEAVADDSTGTPIPLLRMGKVVDAARIERAGPDTGSRRPTGGVRP